MKTLSDAYVVFRQQLTLMLRSPSWVVIGIVQPVLYLVLFAPLLRSALDVSSNAVAYATFVPGLLVLLVMGASLYAGVGLINEVRTGIIDRCRVTSVSRTALLLGRCARDVVAFLVQALIVVGIACAAGLRADPWGVLVTLLVLALVSATLSSVSYVLALRSKHEGSMSGLLQMITQPLLLLSGVMLPLSLAPGWLKTVSEANPLAHVVDGSRDLFRGAFTTSAVSQAVIITVVLAVVILTATSRRFARSVS